MSHGEMSFCELKSKEIINEVDGRKLGKACDLIFSPISGCVMGIVAPHARKGFFFKGQEIFIPFKNISKIGPDVILVRLTPDLSRPDECIDLTHNNFHHEKGNSSHHQEDRSNHQHYANHQAHCQNNHSCDKEKQTTNQNNDEGANDYIKNNECDFKCEKCMLFDCSNRWKNTTASC